LLEIDQATLRDEALGGASGAVRDALNSATPLVPFRDLHDEAGALRVQIVDLADAPRALAAVQAALAPSGEFTVVLEPEGWLAVRIPEQNGAALLAGAAQRTADIVSRRLEPTGALVRISPQTDGRVLVQAMRMRDRAAFAAIVAQRGRLTMAPLRHDEREALVFAPPPAPLRVIEAGAFRDNGGATLSIDIDQQSERSLCRITRDNIGESLAIALDSRALATLPINSEICGGPLLLSIQPSLDAAAAIAHVLDAGALPAPIRVLAQGVGDPPL
jgi:preprotein translocase subunit SecD